MGERAGTRVGVLHSPVGVQHHDGHGDRVQPRVGAAVMRQVLRELAADGGEQRRDLGVGLVDVGRQELDHALEAVGQRERERDGRAQLRAARPARPRRALARQVRDPLRAVEPPHAPGQAPAGRERQVLRGLGERDRALAAAGRVPARGAAQHAGGLVRAPQRAVGPAERLAERRQHARAQLGGLEAGRDVVGDRLLGQQQPAGHARRCAVRAPPPARAARPRRAAPCSARRATSRSKPLTTADSAPGRALAATAMNGRCGSASRTSASALRAGTAAVPAPS